MPGWLKIILNIILLIIPEVIKGFFVKPSSCPVEEKDGDKEKNK